MHMTEILSHLSEARACMQLVRSRALNLSTYQLELLKSRILRTTKDVFMNGGYYSLDYRTGLDWTGLDWTTGLDYRTGILDWTTGLTYFWFLHMLWLV